MAKHDLNLFYFFSGLTRERGLTLFELFSAQKQIFKKDVENFFTSPTEDVRNDLLQRMSSSQELLGQIISSLKHERPETFERIVFSAAQRELVKCQQIGPQIEAIKISS